MKFKAFLMIGPPGSGKGTQSRLVCDVASFFHCSCGEVFRGLAMESELGRTFQAYSRRGLLVPDNIAVNVWLAFIAQSELQGKFNRRSDYLLLDGIPRNTSQARLMETEVDVAGVLHMDGLNKTGLLARLLKRSIDQNRPDDKETEVIQRRLEIYEQESRELLAYFPRKLIYRINAQLEPSAVHSEIVTIIRNHGVPFMSQLEAKIK